MERHKEQHVKCLVKECDFKACDSLVQQHYKFTHESGLFGRMLLCRADTPEQIDKWRAERRRNFPTAQREAKRLAEEAGRELRGEVLQTKQFGKMRQHQHWSHHHSANKEDDPLSYLENDELLDEGTELPLTQAPGAGDDRNGGATALGALLTAYQSEDDDDTCHEQTDAADPDERPPSKRPRMSDSAPALTLHWRRSRCMAEPGARLQRPALLEMLLARDIRHERNLLLQCVRYMCAHEFFRADVSGAAPPATAAPPTTAHHLQDEEWDDDTQSVL